MKKHLNDSDINGNTMAWMADKEREEKECNCKNGKVCKNCQEAEDKYYEEE